MLLQRILIDHTPLGSPSGPPWLSWLQRGRTGTEPKPIRCSSQDQSQEWHKETDSLEFMPLAAAQWPVVTMAVLHSNPTCGKSQLGLPIFLPASQNFTSVLLLSDSLPINSVLPNWTRDDFSEITCNPETRLVHYHLLKSCCVPDTLNEL